MPKSRVDQRLVELGLAPSRSRAQAIVKAGLVRIDGQPVDKASALVLHSAQVTLAGEDHPYVSRGGLKLEGALADLGVDPAGLVAADIGASTGGFTDCLLRRGAARVYAIDVGRDQLHPTLRADPRVIAMEGVNARALGASSLPERVPLVVVDASFIGLGKLLPALFQLLAPGGRIVALVKPQFELGPALVGKRGVVRDDALRTRALAQVVAEAAALGLSALAHADCRIPGPEGNRELFALLAAR
jgi:23S rRNA (cytidine1920-2'-O)/16S rRNA (cytidine1409-2'-O)-methyltransferase